MGGLFVSFDFGGKFSTPRSLQMYFLCRATVGVGGGGTAGSIKPSGWGGVTLVMAGAGGSLGEGGGGRVKGLLALGGLEGRVSRP